MPSTTLRCRASAPNATALRVAAAALATAVATFAFCAPAAAQKDGVQVQNPVVTTTDRWNIALTYYESPGDRESPVVVLLHMKGGNRLVWNNGFAEELNKEGYAVIAVDLRGHGESKPTSAALAASGRSRPGKDLKAADYQFMVTQDLEAVKQFIFDEHQREKLNMRKMAIIATEMSAPVAMNFAMLDWLKRPYNDAPTPALQTPRGQDVRALVLISPEEQLSGMNTNDAVQALRTPEWNVSFLVAYGNKDRKDAGTSQKLYKKLTQVSENEHRMYLADYPIKLRGTDLFGQPGGRIESNILTFLDKHLKQLPDTWRDRKSPLVD